MSRHAAVLQAALPPLAVFAAAMGLAEAVVALGQVPAWLLPPPSAVLGAIARRWDSLGPAAAETLLSALLGFAASAVLGMVMAVGLAASRWVQRAFYPYAIFFQTVPIVAVAPLLVIWLGYDRRAVVASALIVSIFPVIANTLNGLRSTEPALKDLFRLYRAGRWDRLWKLRLPSALPQVLTGLRIAAGLAVIGALVGEVFASQGLGRVMIVSIQENRTEVVFAAVLLGSLLGLLLFGMVNLASYLLLRRWHASEQ